MSNEDSNKKKIPNVPNLRFCENSVFNKKLIGELVIQTGKRAKGKELLYTSYSITNNNGIVNQSEHWEGGSYTKDIKKGYKVVHKNEIAYNPARINVGSVALFQNEIGIVSSLYVCFSTKREILPKYLYYFMKSPIFLKNIQRIQEGGVRSYFFFDKLQKSGIILPSLEYQKKTSDFLSVIDSRIKVQSKIIESLKSLRNGIINLFYKTKTNKVFKITGDLIEEYCMKTSSKNEFPILSSTASGIYLQSEYFNKEAACTYTTGYKIVPKNYCTYRSMSDTGEFHFNKQTLVEKGIVSPAYPVFRIKSNHNNYILISLNNSPEIKRQIIANKSGGTRFALSFSKLCKIQIPWAKEENIIIFENLISSLDAKLMIDNNVLKNMKKQKDYLLANMFI